MHHLVHRKTHLGLHSLHRGHISTAWRDTYLAALPKESKRRAEQADAWTKKAIVAIWTYSLALWEARHAVVHGQTTLQEDSIAMKLLKEKTKEIFRNNQRDPHAIPTSRAYLLDKPIEVVQHFSRQQLRCWIASVDDALATKTQRDAENHKSMKALMTAFLIPRNTMRGKHPHQYPLHRGLHQLHSNSGSQDKFRNGHTRLHINHAV